jgi:oligopeptide transport system permease protein
VNFLSKLSFGFLGMIFFVALFAPWITPHSYDTQDTLNTLALPSFDHLMGTDRLGRDLFSRLIYGARISLFIGVFTSLLALIIGTVYGSISGFVGGRMDGFMMRAVDVIFALPDMLMIIIITVTMGRGVLGMFIALTLVSWVTVARLVRGEVLRVKEKTYVEAALALGASNLRIITKEILPNILGLMVVTMTFRIPAAILAESTLSFIGLGVAPPFSSWGTMANEGWKSIKFYPHLILFPSLAIFFTILSFNFLGDVFRDYLDPRNKAQFN